MRGAPLPKLLGIPTPILPPTAVAVFLWRWFLNTTHSNTHGGNGHTNGITIFETCLDLMVESEVD